MGSKNLKLKDAKDKGDFSWVGSPKDGSIRGDGMAGRNISRPILATRLSRYLRRPVLDQTGLQGFYDFSFAYASEDAEPDVLACIFASVKGIGLKLKTAKGEVEAIVIDQAEKPSGN